MNVKGTAFLAREALMIAALGEGVWRDYIQTYAEGEPLFRHRIAPDTLIPAEAFLALNDDIVDRFYGGDPRAYWRFGERSAAFALTQGQLKGQFGPGDLQKFLAYTLSLWTSYFDEGDAQLQSSGDATVDLWISKVPIQHVYFEYTVMGFAEGGLKHVGARHPEPHCIRGFSQGDPDILYRFRID